MEELIFFKATTAKKLGEVALKTLEQYAPDFQTLAAALTGEKTFSAEKSQIWERVYQRVTEKLRREAVEDFRIDFEDGYGNRADQEEDEHAKLAAQELASGWKEKTLPPFTGIRIKPFSNETVLRSIRTLETFVKTLVNETQGQLPSHFVVTLPKVTHPAQAAAMSNVLKQLEEKSKLPDSTLRFEIMVETTQAIIGPEGTNPLLKTVRAGEGRCVSAHFGTYDYTAGSNITANYQEMDHLDCNFAKHMMKVALLGTGVTLSDGATNIMPVGPHRSAENAEQEKENREVVWRAWQISHRHIRHSLINGFYQGWDLHPAQLPVRYATVFYFFLESLEATTARLKGFMEKAARATLLGDVFDDAATGQGLLNYFLRGLSCGAISEEEAQQTGLSLEEIRSRSFLKILRERKSST